MKELCLRNKNCSSVGTFMTPPEGGQGAVALKTWLKAGKMPCKHKERGEGRGRVEGGEARGRGGGEREREREEGKREETQEGRKREGGTTD